MDTNSVYVREFTPATVVEFLQNSASDGFMFISVLKKPFPNGVMHMCQFVRLPENAESNWFNMQTPRYILALFAAKSYDFTDCHFSIESKLVCEAENLIPFEPNNTFHLFSCDKTITEPDGLGSMDISKFTW